MKRKLLYGFLGILLVANGILLYMIITKVPGKQNPKKDHYLTNELQFSKTQKDQFFALDREHRRKMRSIDDELAKLRRQMFSSYDNEEFSIDSVVLRIGELEASKNKELYTFFKQVRGLCTDGQVDKFDQIIQKVLRKRGPKHPPGYRRGPPK